MCIPPDRATLNRAVHTVCTGCSPFLFQGVRGVYILDRPTTPHTRSVSTVVSRSHWPPLGAVPFVCLFYVCRLRRRQGTLPPVPLLFFHLHLGGYGGDLHCLTALRETWSGGCFPRPPYAFERSMICESCKSHHLSHLAALFIDTRAE